MTQEANKLKRKQDLKKYLVFALMFAVFVGSLWLIFAPSEKGRKEQEQSVGFNTELPDPRNAGIVGDKKTAYEQDMMRRKQEEKMRTLEELSFGTEKPDSTVRLSGQDEILSLESGNSVFRQNGLPWQRLFSIFDLSLPGHQPDSGQFLRGAERRPGKGGLAQGSRGITQFDGAAA